MKMQLVAKKDFLDAKRSRSLYIVGALFTLLGLGVGYAYGEAASNTQGPTGPALIQFLLVAGLFFLPLVALFFSQNDIVSKRKNGEMKVLLGLPFSREDILFGSFLGRSAVSVTILAVYFGVAHVVALVMLAPIDVVVSLAAFLFTALFLVVFVGIAVGISASVGSTTKASVGALGLFFVFWVLWDFIPSIVLYVFNGFQFPSGPTPEWVAIFSSAEPFVGARNLTIGLIPKLQGSFSLFGGPYPDNPAYYQQPVAGALVLAFWLLVPLGLGYVRFRDADL
ncbi:ABC transporter permease subunit [Haloarchaeobius sp. DFWS5]|uniref:ABC transporter permease subunit n=1 Tax=Haloarchaeobius sp. DFWS5 TaxID=3446114 RepID=UPI003EC01396